MNQNLKRYLISSGVTFLAGFLMVFATELQSLSIESLTKSAVIGILLLALRAGLKALFEYVIPLLVAFKKK